MSDEPDDIGNDDFIFACVCVFLVLVILGLALNSITEP